jgi:hypothetical protein
MTTLKEHQTAMSTDMPELKTEAIGPELSALKMKLRDAVNCSLTTCQTDEERAAVVATIVEFFCAIGLDDSDYVEVLSNCGGMDVDTDDAIDSLIEEYEAE